MWRRVGEDEKNRRGYRPGGGGKSDRLRRSDSASSAVTVPARIGFLAASTAGAELRFALLPVPLAYAYSLLRTNFVRRCVQSGLACLVSSSVDVKLKQAKLLAKQFAYSGDISEAEGVASKLAYYTGCNAILLVDM